VTIFLNYHQQTNSTFFYVLGIVLFIIYFFHIELL